MRCHPGLAAIGLVLSLSHCRAQPDARAEKDNCAAIDGPPIAFGPATQASDSGRVYSSLLSSDGREFYFFKRVGPGEEDYGIYRSVLSGTEWSPAERLQLGGSHSDLYPSFSPDERRLVFASYRPAPGDTTGRVNSLIWYSTRTDSGWMSPRYVSSSKYGEYHAGLKQDAAGTVRFNRNGMPFEMRWSDTSFAAATPVAPHPAAAYWAPRLGDSVYVWNGIDGPNGLVLLQISRIEQPGGRRSPAHYFATHREQDAWSPLVPAGGGMSEGAPNFAWFSKDGCYVHYTENYATFRRVPISTVVRGTVR